MGLKETPHVLIVGPDPDRQGQVPFSIVDAAGMQVVNGRPIISFRNGVFGSTPSLLTPHEALAVADHELWHLEKYIQRGESLEVPTAPAENLSPRKKQEALNREIKVALLSRTEESAADLNAVNLGRGPDMLGAFDKLSDLVHKDFDHDPRIFGMPAGSKYEDMENNNGTILDHPLDPTRRAALVNAIQQHDRKEHAVPLWRKLNPF